MFCKYCGASVSDGSAYCSSCGMKLEESTEDQPVALVPERDAGSAAPTTDTGEETSVVFDFGSQSEDPYSGMQWHSVSQSETTYSTQDWQPEEPTPNQNNKKKIRRLIAGIALTLVVTAVLVVWMLVPFGPGFDILLAAKNTLEAENLTMEFQYTGEESVEGSVQLDIHRQKKELTMYARSEAEEGATEIIIYQGHLLLGFNGEFIGNKMDTEAFFIAYEDLLDGGEIDWEEWIKSLSETLYEDLETYIDFEALEQCLKVYAGSLNDENWLEEYAGFREENREGVTCYSYRPELYDFAYGSLQHLESAFRTAEDYQEMMEGLDASKADLDEMDLELTIGLDDRRLHDLDVTYREDGDGYTFHLDFKQIGKTTIDTAKLDEILEDALILG